MAEEDASKVERLKRRRDSIANLRKIIAETKGEATSSGATKDDTSATVAPRPQETPQKHAAGSAILDWLSDPAVKASDTGGKSLFTPSKYFDEDASDKAADEVAKDPPSTSTPSQGRGRESSGARGLGTPPPGSEQFVAFLKANYGKLQQCYDELYGQHEDLKAAFSKLQQNYNYIFMEANIAKSEKTATPARMTKLSDSLGMKPEEMAEKAQRANALEAELRLLNTQYAKLQKDHNHLLVEQERGKESHSEERKRLMQSFEAESQDALRTKTQLENVKVALQNAKEELFVLREFQERSHLNQNDKARLREAVHRVESELMEQKLIGSDLEAQLTSCKQENRKLRADYEKIAAENSQRNGLYDEVRREREVLTSQLSMYKSTARNDAQLQESYAKLQAELQATREEKEVQARNFGQREKSLEYSQVRSLPRPPFLPSPSFPLRSIPLFLPSSCTHHPIFDSLSQYIG